MSDITSRPYNPKMACERCVFLRGEHSPWCEHSRPTTWRVEGNAGSDGGWFRDRYMKALEITPEQKQHWLHGSWSLDPSMPKDMVAFISPRKYVAGVPEPAEEWAKRCAVITNVKEP